MFANLKQGSQIYILHTTSATPYVEVGNVEMVSNAMQMVYIPGLAAMPIDISVRIGEKVIPFQKLPANAESANVTDSHSNESVTIACSREAINTEVQAMRQKSIEIVNSVEFHKNRIGTCDELLKQLNPEIAQKEAQQAEISELRAQLASMQQVLNEIRDKRTSSAGTKAKE